MTKSDILFTDAAALLDMILGTQETIDQVYDLSFLTGIPHERSFFVMSE